MHNEALSECNIVECGSATDRALRPPFAKGRVLPPSHSPPATPTTGSMPFDSGAIPGRPIVPTDTAEYVRKELVTARLDRIFLHLWWAGRPGNISPLHAQKMMKRDIVLTENVGLHLVWFDTTYYVKPLPEWLLNWHFYDRVLCNNKDLMLAANGFLRTYIRLVQHPSDFRIARELGLLPACLDTWEAWSGIVASVRELDDIEDIEVSKRYHYGELRLRRLNQIYRAFHRRITTRCTSSTTSSSRRTLPGSCCSWAISPSYCRPCKSSSPPASRTCGSRMLPTGSRSRHCCSSPPPSDCSCCCWWCCSYITWCARFSTWRRKNARGLAAGGADVGSSASRPSNSYPVVLGILAEMIQLGMGLVRSSVGDEEG